MSGFTELQWMNMPNHDDAHQLLRWLAYDTAPIMNRRRWKVHILREFLPKDPCLLGKYSLRSRVARVLNVFIPFSPGIEPHSVTELAFPTGLSSPPSPPPTSFQHLPLNAAVQTAPC